MTEGVKAVDESLFKKALSHFASGVTVVTTEVDGERYGMTVAAFSSLSLNPPLVLICIEKSVKTHEMIARAGKFAVNFLSSDQEEISNRFASRRDDRFSGLEITEGGLGLPILGGAFTTLECKLHSTLPGGDHSIFVGEVVSADVHEGAPLIYFRSGYHTTASVKK